MARDLSIILGIGKKKPGDEPPPSYPSAKATSTSPGSSPMGDESPEEETAEGAGGQLSPDEVNYSSGDLCESCSNMNPNGQCDLYHFPVEPDGHCQAGYSPKEAKSAESGLGAPPMSSSAPSSSALSDLTQ
jgi:hypothetical protein